MNRPSQRDIDTRSAPSILLLLTATFLLAGCQEEVYHGLSERQANRLVVALETEGVSADKARDSSGEGKWMVTVPSGQKVRAWKLLEAQGLPRPETKGFGEFYPTGGLIPTASEERILYQYATAQELQKTLLKVDGVVGAQVNLVLPEKPRVRLANTEIEPPRASVLVEYQPTGGAEKGQPLDAAAVKRLVVGGVEGLERANVEVIITAADDPLAGSDAPDFAKVGPVSVAPRSKALAQTVIGGMGLMVILLSGGVAFLLWQRVRPDEKREPTI